MRDSSVRLMGDQYNDDDPFDDFDAAFGDVSGWDDDSENVLKAVGDVLKAPTQFVQRSLSNFRPSPALAGGQVAGPGGTAPVRFQRPVATAESIEQLKADVKKAIAEVRQETTTNLTRLDKKVSTAAGQVETLGKTVKASAARVGALEQRAQMATLLPLIQGKPRLETIALAGGSPQTVTSATYKDDKNDMLLPLILMGGLGGGSGGLGGDNTALMMIALMR